jgi:hypothetical protein
MAEIITEADILSEHGQEMLDRMLDYGFDHTDLNGRPCWTAEEAERIFGLIEIEDREIEEREEA